MKPAKYYSLTTEERERYRMLEAIWNDCKVTIKRIGNNVITDVMYILSQVEFTQRPGVDILGVAQAREQLKLERLSRQDH